VPSPAAHRATNPPSGRFGGGWLVALLVAAPLRAEVPPGSPVADALERAEAAVARIVAVPDAQRTFENTPGAVDDLVARLELDTNMTVFMAYVSTDDAQRDRGRRAEEDVTNWMNDLYKREDLARAVKAMAYESPPPRGEQKRLLEFMLRDFRRAGMELTPEEREKLRAIHQEITRLGIEFEKNITEDDTVVPLTRRELVGVPEDYFDDESLERSGDVYFVSMSYPHFVPVMDHCDDEATRRKVWLAYKRRGGPKNVEILEKLLRLRAEAAAMLGYENAAAYEIEIRMAKETAAVRSFFETLRPLVRRKALRDYDELVAAKRRHTGDDRARIQPWDTSYYIDYVRNITYAVDSQRVREYLPLEAVVEGLFSITQSLYGLEYRDVTAEAAARGRPIWHEDVRLYEVWDRAEGSVLGEFYVDLHPRKNKYTHAAQWGLAQHKVWADGTVTRPLAALVCNFSKPTPQRPSLLTHDEIETFFHEFGHCLHTILSEARTWRFAGTSVERDFVESPSQMFENWVWDAEVLGSFARHYRTGEPFPQELLEAMIRARNLASGMLAERQFFYGIFDLECHLDPEGDVDTIQLAHDLWDPEKAGVELYDPVPGTYFHASFGHLVGYQAGYYGYQWSLVYASDMFQRFKELGMLSPAAGTYYRDKILARGGSVDGLEMVREYLGREPRMDAYLRHLGLEVEEAAP
jgi:thimet oligopeptidase